mgnify:CR=1 FL=1
MSHTDLQQCIRQSLVQRNIIQQGLYIHSYQPTDEKKRSRFSKFQVDYKLLLHARRAHLSYHPLFWLIPMQKQLKPEDEAIANKYNLLSKKPQSASPKAGSSPSSATKKKKYVLVPLVHISQIGASIHFAKIIA